MVSNEDDLKKVESMLLSASIAMSAIREPDRNDELMAIGIAPCDRDLVRPYVRNLRLLKGNE